MAKRKKRASADESSHHHLNEKVVEQITGLLIIAVFLFLLASVFDAAGSAGKVVYNGMRYTLGAVTPVYALFLVYIAIRQFYPKIRMGWKSWMGVILFVVTLAGILHSLAAGDLAQVASSGNGGGMIGYTIYNIFDTILGAFLGRFILFVGLFSGIMLFFNRPIPGLELHLKKEKQEEGTEGEEFDEGKVRVMGEIGGNKEQKNLLPRIGGQKPLASGTGLPLVKQPMQSRRINNWVYPSVSQLEKIGMRPKVGNIKKNMELIKKTLEDFGISVTVEGVNVGPTVSQYTLKPAEGVKLTSITARQNDLALCLAAESLRVEAPIPGKSLVGVEVPNEEKATVALRDVIENKMFQKPHSRLGIVLGLDAAGDPAVADMARMPHLLIAGATGSGKSVCINSIIVYLLLNNSPEELRLILVDPKRVELTGYNGLPHLLTPVITEPKDTVRALAWCVEEMDRRYKLFANCGKKNIDSYNQDPELGTGPLPYIVLIIDELADLMMVAAREVEGSIVRLAQMARAVGIHLIIATQRPSVNVITGLIKANVPTRIAFAVASQVDSRTIIDMGGAEKLLGYGDMLYVTTDIGRPRRLQGVYVSEKDINYVIAHIKQQEPGDRYDPAVLETRVESRLGGSGDFGSGADDELSEQAYDLFKQIGKASTTMLQTRLSIGYARANRIMQILEDRGLIGPARGAKPREVFGVPMADDSDEYME
jgi:S-DNA-T family DNA segregation ATPase FtsK/SpoIIIE